MKTLFLVHGRGFKPPKNKLKKLWLDALSHGVKRDYGKQEAKKVDEVCKAFIYYGDLSNKLLNRKNRNRGYDQKEDVQKRRETLIKLKSYLKEDFNKSTYLDISSPIQ